MRGWVEGVEYPAVVVGVPCPFALGHVVVVQLNVAVAVAYQVAVGGRAGDDDGCLGTLALRAVIVERYEKVIDEHIVGCVIAHDKVQRNGIAQAKAGRYGAKVESDFGIVHVAGLRQAEGERCARADPLH